MFEPESMNIDEVLATGELRDIMADEAPHWDNTSGREALECMEEAFDKMLHHELDYRPEEAQEHRCYLCGEPAPWIVNDSAGERWACSLGCALS